MSAHLALIGSAVLAAGLFSYAFIRSRTQFLTDAMDHQGLVIGIQKESRPAAAEDADLDEVLYAPLEEEIALWRGDPPIFNDGALLPWADLKDGRPDLVEEVPADLRELLDEAEERMEKVTSLRGIVKNMTVAELKDQGDDLEEAADVPGTGGTKLRLDVDGEWAKYVELSGIWITRTPFRDWCRQYVDKNHPEADEWEVATIVANEQVGGTDAAEKLAKRVFSWLESKEIAVGLRDQTEELAALGDRILDRIQDVRS